MEFGVTILCAVIAIVAYIAGRVGYAIENDKEEKSDYKKMNDSINEAINEEDKQTRNLLINTLEEIGCQPEIDNDNNIIFKYQGEEFKIDASNDKCSIWIYDLAWMGIATSDTNADFLKQAINKVNQNSAVTNLYTEYKGYIVAHCKIVTYFTYNIPDYKGFFKAVLDAFFTTHQQVRDEFMDLTKNQEQKERVEIKGFHS